MDVYYKNLNLSIPILNDSAPLEDLKFHYETNMNDSMRKFIHPLFLNLLSTKNTYISFIESFYSHPNIQQPIPIHIDSRGGDYIKINYVIGGKDSTMNWYKPKSATDQKTEISGIGNEYISFERDRVDLIDSAVINPIGIVQVGIPHNITNLIEDRLCISMYISNLHNRQRLTMNEAIEIFSEYILD